MANVGERMREEEETEESDQQLPDYCRKLTVRDSNGIVKELIFPKALDLDRPKRSRTTFSVEQLTILENAFQKSQYLVGRDRSDLAEKLHLSETQIKVWFQNRRTKQKRDHTKVPESLKGKSESSSVSPPSIDFMRLFPPTSVAAAAVSFSHPGPVPALPPSSAMYHPFPPHIPFPGLTGPAPPPPHPHYFPFGAPPSLSALSVSMTPPCNMR